MCGCARKGNLQAARPTIGFRSTPTTVNPTAVRAAALAQAAAVASKPVDANLSAERRELERKRREAILKRLGK
jgi:hypothetical protein